MLPLYIINIYQRYISTNYISQHGYSYQHIIG